MTSNNWIGSFTGRVASARKIAAEKLGQAAKNLDEKLKKAEDEMTKKREKIHAEDKANAVETLWRATDENPDGEIIKRQPEKPMITVPTSDAFKALTGLLSSALTTTTPTEIPKPASPEIEPEVIGHDKRRKRRATTTAQPVCNGSGHESGPDHRSIQRQQRGNRRAVVDCLHEMIDEIVLQEDVQYSLDHLLDIVSTVDDLAEQASFLSPLVVLPEPTRESELELSLTKESESEVEDEKEPSVETEESEEEMKNPSNLIDDEDEDEDEDDLMSYFKVDNSAPVVTSPKVSEKPRRVSSSSSTSSSEDISITINIPTRRTPPPVEAPAELVTLQSLLSSINNEKSESDDEEGWESEEEQEKRETIDLPSPPIPDEKPSPVVAEEPPPVEEPDIQSIQSSSTETTSDSSIPEPKEESLSDTPSPSPSLTPSYFSFSLDTAEKAVVTESKRMSIAHYHSLPPEIKIIYMSCSSEYLYICTSDHHIFFAKIHSDSHDLPLKWQHHPSLAERLDVSPNNRAAWRWHNRCLYISFNPSESPPLGSDWEKINLGYQQTCLSFCVTDQCGWLIKDDGSLILLKVDENSQSVVNVMCPFQLTRVVGSTENIAVSTKDGPILVRYGCTADRLEGDGWIFVQHTLGPLDDFLILSLQEIFVAVDPQHRLCIRSWSSEDNFFEVLCNDDAPQYSRQHLVCANSRMLFLTDCQEQVHLFSDSVVGTEWKTVQKNTRLQRLVRAFSDEEHVWALNTAKMICSSDGKVLEKPRQAVYLTHASFVPNENGQGTVLWALDESCNIYVRPDASDDSQWDQLDQVQFEWTRRLIHMVCNNAGVWAVDDHGHIYFRHGHAGTRRSYDLDDMSVLPAAWISIPGAPKKNRSFTQIFCGPADWMVYATDNKQAVYARCGITADNRVGTSWKPIDDCSALELAISEHSLWLLTSCGQIQCRENISLENPIGTRSTTLPGVFLSLTVSADDKQVWALDSNRNLLKLDRLTILLEK